MIIQINPNLRLNLEDKRNFTIESMHINQATGEKYWTALGFYARIDDAFDALLTKHLPKKSKEIISIAELKNELTQHAIEIKEAINKITFKGKLRKKW